MEDENNNREQNNRPDEYPTDNRMGKNSKWKKLSIPVLAILGVLMVGGGVWIWIDQGKYITTEKAAISAPLIQLTPKTPGILKMVFVQEGDGVRAHEPVARVGNEMITTEVSGTAIMVKQDIGAMYNPGQPVVTMIEPKELTVIARIEEDKGLKEIHAGQKVHFTVDAYGSQQFDGTVAEVASTSRSGDVVFNISDKREEQEYEIKISYDHTTNPPFQNGMSARVWIIK